MKKSIINGLLLSFSFIVGLCIFGFITYKVYAALSTTTNGSPLTATNWNDVINKVNSLESTVTTLQTTVTSQSATISALNSIPAGSIVAFNSSSCPSGWSEYTLAYGRFLRGIDKSGTNIDPDGQRSIGNTQNDAFQGHRHQMYYSYGATSGYGLTPLGSNAGNSTMFADGNNRYQSRTAITDTTNGSPRISNETRPKNISVLYCIKN